VVTRRFTPPRLVGDPFAVAERRQIRVLAAQGRGPDPLDVVVAAGALGLVVFAELLGRAQPRPHPFADLHRLSPGLLPTAARVRGPVKVVGLTTDPRGPMLRHGVAGPPQVGAGLGRASLVQVGGHCRAGVGGRRGGARSVQGRGGSGGAGLGVGAAPRKGGIGPTVGAAIHFDVAIVAAVLEMAHAARAPDRGGVPSVGVASAVDAAAHRQAPHLLVVIVAARATCFVGLKLRQGAQTKHTCCRIMNNISTMKEGRRDYTSNTLLC